MKKALKILLSASLLIMSTTFVTYANNAVVGIEDEEVIEVTEGFVPYSPVLPQDWTLEQWEEWRLALEMCLFEALDRAQELVDDASAVLVAAGVPVVIVPSTLIVASSGNFIVASSRNIDLTSAQIEVLTALVNHYTDLIVRIHNFLAEFEREHIPFEIALITITELCEEVLVLNTDLEKALSSLGGDDPTRPTDPLKIETSRRPGVSGQPEESQRPILPQTGTTVVLASIGAVGVALTVIGTIAAHAKRKNNNS